MLAGSQSVATVELGRFSHTESRRDAGEGPGICQQTDTRRAPLAAEAYLDSTLSTASKRNEVDAALSLLAANSVGERRARADLRGGSCIRLRILMMEQLQATACLRARLGFMVTILPREYLLFERTWNLSYDDPTSRR